MVNEKMVSFRVEPYIKEAVIQAVVDLLIIAIITTVLLLAKIPVLICVIIALVYFFLALMLHYKVVIQAATDKRKKDYITETVRVKSVKDEYSFAGNRLGYSYIRLFYPKDMHVGKYKIKVLSDCCKEENLRSVMSFRRSIKFAVLEKQEIEYLKFTYLKRSKILVNVELVQTPNKLSGKQEKVVAKALHFINTSV